MEGQYRAGSQVKGQSVNSGQVKYVLAFVAAAIGFLWGLSVGSGVRGGNIGLTILLALVFTYVFWSSVWGIPVAWGWFKRFIKRTRVSAFEFGELGNLFGFVGLFVAAFAFFLVVLVAGYTYGVCGGAIYQYKRYKAATAAN